MSLANFGEYIILVNLIVTLNIFSDMVLFDFLFKRESDLKSSQKSQSFTPKELGPGKTINIKLQNLTPNEVTQCELGGSIKFWNKPNSNEILIYRQGSMEGGGLLGMYSGKYHSLLMHHLMKDDLQNSTILSKSGSSMVIDFRIESRVEFEKEFENRDQERKDKLIATLKKPSKRKYDTAFDGNCDKLKPIKLKEGKIFDVEFLNFDTYITNMTTANHPKIYLVDENGKRVIDFGGSQWDQKFITLLRNGLSSNKKIKAEIVELYSQNIEIIRFFDYKLK